jgi:hypothetical protein
MVKSSITKMCLVLWLIALTVLLALIPQQVYACSCVPAGPPADELARSSAVFSGKVSSKHVPLFVLQPSIDPVQVTFNVSRVWKGPAFQTLVVHTGVDGGSCGYGFQDDQEYLVYAFGEEGHLRVSLCSLTKPLANAAEDLSALGEGMIPLEENAGGNSFPPTCVFPVALVGLLRMLPISARMRVAKRRIPNK